MYIISVGSVELRKYITQVPMQLAFLGTYKPFNEYGSML